MSATSETEILTDKRWHGAADAGDLPRPAPIKGGYMLIPHTSWATYESMLSDKGDNSLPRLAFLNGTLEIRIPGAEHEQLHRIAALLVELLFSGVGYRRPRLGRHDA